MYKNLKYSISFLLVFVSMIQCSNDIKDKEVEIPEEEIPEEENPNTNSISYDWDTHTWQGIDETKTYGISNNEVHESVRISQGNKTSYSVDGNYYRVRIPVADVTKKGTIVVVSEGRLGDNPAVDPGTDRDWDHVLISRSTDLGKTWDTQVIYDGDDTTDFGAIAICTDKKNDGRIHILGTYQGGMLIMHSYDDGVTWTHHNQSGPKMYSTFDGNDIRMRPANGIQLMADSQYNGDFFLGGVTGYNAEKRMALIRYNFDSDTWVEHDILNVAQKPEIAEEMTLMELEGEFKNMIRTISRPSIEVAFKQELLYDLSLDSSVAPGWENSKFPYVRCNQNAKRYSSEYANQTSRLIYTSTKNLASQRLGGNISISYNEGKLWQTKQLVDNIDYYGYSQIVVLPDGSLGSIYEGANSAGFDNSALYFKRFTVGWLTDGADLGLKK